MNNHRPCHVRYVDIHLQCWALTGTPWVQIITKTRASLPTQRHLARLQGNHATLGQLQAQDDYNSVIKQIRVIAGERVTGKGCNIVWDPPKAQIEWVLIVIFMKAVLNRRERIWQYHLCPWPSYRRCFSLDTWRTLLASRSSKIGTAGRSYHPLWV